MHISPNPINITLWNFWWRNLMIWEPDRLNFPCAFLCFKRSGIWSVPCYLYFYALGGYREWMPYSWCFAYNSLTEFIPAAFHTASIWLTVTLAVQRYIYVCHALTARQLCTIPTFVRIIVAIFAVAVLSQLSRFFDCTYMEVTVRSRLDPNKVPVCALP